MSIPGSTSGSTHPFFNVFAWGHDDKLVQGFPPESSLTINISPIGEMLETCAKRRGLREGMIRPRINQWMFPSSFFMCVGIRLSASTRFPFGVQSAYIYKPHRRNAWNMCEVPRSQGGDGK